MITAYWRFVLRLLHFKAGEHLNVSFWPLHVGFIEISRSLFKQSRNLSLITQFYVLGFFLVIFGYIWEEINFLTGLVKLGEIRNVEDSISCVPLSS